MHLSHLSIAGFRNIDTVRIEPGNRFNLFYGRNGQGKTNLLEAIYLLGSPRSFRHARLPDLICHKAQTAQIQGEIESGGSRNTIRVTLEHAGRRVELDGKGIQRASELHGRMGTVVFSPDDTGMVKFGPETRRRYLDRAAYMGDVAYLHCWHDYYRILKQRNQLLKNQDKTCLDVWTEKLAEAGAELIFRRLQFVSSLSLLLKQHYQTISGGSETAGMRYRPEGILAADIPGITADLRKLFEKHTGSDERNCTTTSGPHRDDISFSLDEKPLKTLGSQGQQKSFVLALKMAEIDNLHGIYGESPLLLLDDISSELDSQRTRNLTDFLISREIQVFITTTERSPALLRAAAHCAVFRVEDGNLTFEGNEPHE